MEKISKIFQTYQNTIDTHTTNSKNILIDYNLGLIEDIKEISGIIEKNKDIFEHQKNLNFENLEKHKEEIETRKNEFLTEIENSNF
jgi:hypothetical protein